MICDKTYIDFNKKDIFKFEYVFFIGVFRRGNKPPVLLGEDKKL